MGRLIRTACSILLLTVTFAVTADAARNKKDFDKLSAEILESLQSFYPVQATSMGIHAYDQRLADFSDRSVRDMQNKLTDYTKRLYQYRNFKFDPEDEIDFKLIRSNVEMALVDLKQIAWHKKSPQLYVDEAIDGVYSLLLSQHAPLSERVVLVISRMKQVPDLFATARRNLRKPPEVYIELALESLDSGQRFYQEAAAELMRQFPERADEILKVSTAAREAMNDFSVFLQGITPGDSTSFAIGKQNFDYMLSHQYFVNYDSDSLLRMGENLLAEADEQYQRYKEFVESDYQNGQDSIFVPASFNRQDILDYYQWETDQMRVFLTANEIVSVPDDIAPVRVMETPTFLRSMIGAIAYQPAGPFDDKQEGIFYVRPVPLDLDKAQLAARYRYVHRRGFRGSVVHEAYPGHHLQTQIAARNPSPIRKWQSNMMLTEGWALYCEEMMYNAGLYGGEDPPTWLAILGGIRYRAARIVADVKLHTGQFTYEQCVDFMINTLDAQSESDKEYHRTMVRKYTLTPTRWMCYLVGKKEIERLRDDVAARDGDSFSEEDFYDRLLEEGSIPIPLIREAFGL